MVVDIKNRKKQEVVLFDSNAVECIYLPLKYNIYFMLTAYLHRIDGIVKESKRGQQVYFW